MLKSGLIKIILFERDVTKNMENQQKNIRRKKGGR